MFSQLDFKFFQSCDHVTYHFSFSLFPSLPTPTMIMPLNTWPFLLLLGRGQISKVLELLNWIKDRCKFYNIIDTLWGKLSCYYWHLLFYLFIKQSLFAIIDPGQFECLRDTIIPCFTRNFQVSLTSGSEHPSQIWGQIKWTHE